MTRILSLVISVLIVKLSAAQQRPGFDTSKITASTKLICRTMHYEKEQKFSHLNFYISNPTAIKAIVAGFKFGSEVVNHISPNSIEVSLVENYLETQRFTVNPQEETALFKGHTYTFDINQVKNLASAFPFTYRFEEVVFKDTTTYFEYFNKQKKDSLFISHYPPSFKFAGSFKIKFPRNYTYQSPKAIIEFLNPLIEKIVQKNEYMVGYALDKENMNDNKNYVMTIYGSKLLYDKLNVAGRQKRKWEPAIEKGIFFYKMN